MNTNTPLKRILLCLCLLAVSTAAFAEASKLPEGWLTDWDQAQAKAKADGKPILAVFSAEWCGPCQMMIKEVYPKAEVKKMLESWVPVYLDDVKMAKVHEQYKIEGYPTFVLFSPAAVEEDRFVGGKMAKDFVDRVTTGRETARRMTEIKDQLTKTPDNAALHKELGDLYLKLDDIETALESYRTAAKLDPADGVAVADELFIFDNLPESEDEVEAALAKFEGFEKTFPKSDRLDLAAYFHARILAFMERYADAIKVLEAASARFPESAYASDITGMAEALRQETAAPVAQ